MATGWFYYFRATPTLSPHVPPTVPLSPSVNNAACLFCCLALGTEPSSGFHYSRLPLSLLFPSSAPSLTDLKNSLFGLCAQMMAERVLMPAHNPSSSRSASTNNNINSSAGATVMERAPHDNQQQQQQQQSQAAPLRCPRCDSTNTKFCYYNNYSLSQPRHFCKACKRYWTRGGTLRNVPVGGGCRKNKRVKRPTTSACATPSDPSPPLSIPPPISLPNPSPMNIPSRGGDLNPLLYNLTAASSDMGLNFPVFRQRMELPPSCGVQSSISIPSAAYDLQPQLNALGLGFASNQHDNDDDYTSGFGSQLTQLQQTASLSSAASLLHDYSLFGSSLSTATATSLLVSSLKQPKKVEDYHALLPYDDLQSSANGNLGGHKDVKIENEGHVMSNRIDWPVPCENNSYEGMAIASTTGSIDSSSLYWNAPIGAWPDAANYGPSLAPLI